MDKITVVCHKDHDKGYEDYVGKCLLCEVERLQKREWEELDVNDAMNLIAEHITDPSPELRNEIYGLIAEADMLLQEKNGG